MIVRKYQRGMCSSRNLSPAALVCHEAQRRRAAADHSSAARHIVPQAEIYKLHQEKWRRWAGANINIMASDRAMFYQQKSCASYAKNSTMFIIENKLWKNYR